MSQSDAMERPIITVTEEAAAVIKAACAQDPISSSVVRFSVERQGDSLVHGIRLEAETAPDDVIFEQHDLTMAVHQDQVPLLAGTSIDYRSEGAGGRFVVANPNLKR